MLSLSFNDFLIELTPKPTSQCASESLRQITAVKAGSSKAEHGWTGPLWKQLPLLVTEIVSSLLLDLLSVGIL